MLMLGVSTALLALGAAAAGWTSAGAEISAAVTSLAFAVFAAALLAGGVANCSRSLHRSTLAAGWPRSVWPFRTCSSSRSGRRSALRVLVLPHNETRTFFEAS
jgi:hypothetical protein